MFGRTARELRDSAAQAKTEAAIARQQIEDHMKECAARYKTLKDSIDDLSTLTKRTMIAALSGLLFLVYRYLQAKGTLP